MGEYDPKKTRLPNRCSIRWYSSTSYWETKVTARPARPACPATAPALATAPAASPAAEKVVLVLLIQPTPARWVRAVHVADRPVSPPDAQLGRVGVAGGAAPFPA